MELTNETPVNLTTETVYMEYGAAVATEQTGPQIRVEWLLYAALVLLALVLRLPELGTSPLNDAQAHEALAAFRVIAPSTDVEGIQIIPRYPLMFSANTLLMTTAGTGTPTVLLPTALVGILLILLPMFFRRWLGQVNALILSGLLLISPVLLLASRSMTGTVWSMALAVGALYCIARYVESRSIGFAVIGTSLLVLLVLMAEPAGFITFLGLSVGIVLATRRDSSNYQHNLIDYIKHWPFMRGLAVSVAVVGLTATVFLLYPRGLSSIGEVLGGALRGFIQRPAGYPFAMPLLTSLLYEPVLWVFGLIGAWQVLNREQDNEDDVPANFIQRALIGWLIVSFLATLLYPGAEPGNALWFTIPLAGLAAVAVEKMLTPVRDQFWDVPIWGPFVHGLAVVAMLAISGINLIVVGQIIRNTAPDATPIIDQPIRAVFLIPAIMLVVITFFLVGSMWGAKASWKGIGIGFFTFLGIYSIGAGWQAVMRHDDPRELWWPHPAAHNLILLEQTLMTASERVTGMPYDVAVTVLQGQNGPIQDGALAWQLRHFLNTEYVKQLAPTTNVPVIIAPKDFGAPNVSAAYVGQDFPTYIKWDLSSLSWDILSWLYSRETRVLPEGDNYVIAWVRSDVYGVAEQQDNNNNVNPNGLSPVPPAELPTNP